MVKRFHDQTQAQLALQNFINRFQHHAIPELEITVIQLATHLNLAQILKHIGFSKSTSEAIRLIQQGGVKIDGVKIENAGMDLDWDKPYLIQVGKRRIMKIMLKKDLD